MTELTFLGRILEELPMTEEEEKSLIVDICEGLRAAWLDYMTQDPAWLPGYKHRLYKLELSVLRLAIKVRLEESWYEGNLGADVNDEFSIWPNIEDDFTDADGIHAMYEQFNP